MDIRTLFAKYKGVQVGSLTSNQQDEIEQKLQYITSKDLITFDDHRAFIELLSLCRSTTVKELERLGRNFKKMLESLLSVGEDGVYSNSLRFIYELIQNVDDCDYIDLENCKLDIRFDTINDTIILSYNELGFTPENVIGITGIAGGTKNISGDKVEIGEKGIGFKSVFGIAESVLVQSGKFSFELHRGNFVVPVPAYNNYSEVHGTRLTLKLKPKTVQGIYYNVVKQYSQSTVLWHKNPILFLNKLTHVQFFVDDSFRYLKFHVSRGEPTDIGDMTLEDDVLISVDITDPSCAQLKNEIHCYRYKMPIVYDRKACVSRYSDETEFQRKKHFLVAVFPHVNEIDKVDNKSNAKGSLYSFLPTQIKITVPLLLHVPYKLDVSREYIDPQDNSRWFSYTNETLSGFFKTTYSDLAMRVKEEIVRYLPRKNVNIFLFDNEKVNCLKRDDFRGAALIGQKLFHTVDNTFEKAADVLSFRVNENVDDPIAMYLLLSPHKRLFVPPSSVDMTAYGVEVIDNAYHMLFEKAIGDCSITSDAFDMLLTKKDFDFGKAIDAVGTKSLTIEQILTICKHQIILEAFQKNAYERIKKEMRPAFNTTSDFPLLDESSKSILEDALGDIELSKELMQYIRLIRAQYGILPSIVDDVYFSCSNILLLSENEPLSAFASFAKSIAGNNTILSSLQLRQESEKLNAAVFDKSMSNIDFLRLLQNVRSSVRTILGARGYRNFIQIINDSGTDENRFINELLQNTDDCDYTMAKGVPKFSCTCDGSTLTTTYNEDGFTKANVRSITAIGETTKKQIQFESSNPIGEKGVGFKSVFGIATEVAIHSNGFHFRLTKDKPTIPQKVDAVKIADGTQMIFTLDKPLTDAFFTEESVLTLCMCLRKLKIIQLGIFTVEIEDSANIRDVFINGEKYSFEKFEHPFTVTDKTALEERENRQRKIDPQQKICFYRPADKNTSDKIKAYCLYSGLPTTIKMNIPLIVDAPFEVTTSREGILQSSWNKIIREEVYNALVAMLHSIKHEKKVDVFAYVNEAEIFKNVWLNDYPLKNKVANEELMPLLDGAFIASGKQECWIYPDICRYLFINKMAEPPQRNIIATAKHSQILAWLGCKNCSSQEIINVIAEAIRGGHITNEPFKKQLYPYLKNIGQNIMNDSYCKTVLYQLAMVPVKPINGSATQYVSCGEKIYTAPNNLSTSEYYLLDEKILSTNDFYEIFRKTISPMDDMQRQGLYREKIITLLDNPNNQYIAEQLLEQFNANRSMLNICQHELKGRINQVPFKFCNGSFYTGNAFVNSRTTTFYGDIVNKLIVAPEYHEFAKYLGCTTVTGIHYDDIDVEIDVLISEDVEDFLHGDFEYKNEIIRGFIVDKKVSYELIIQYGLERFVQSDDVDSDDYEFPTHKVKNIQSIRDDVLSAELNKITSQMVTEKKRIPTFEFTSDEKRGYALEEYRPKNGNGIHCCQMCQKPKSQKYIRVNSIEYEPAFAWKQMQLCLCLEHSKDFESLREDKDIVEKFITALMDADVDDYEPIIIPMDNREIHFTATHLAYVQEILRRHKSIEILKDEDD